MKLIEIFEGTLFQAQMVKNLLEIEGIESFLKNEIIARSPAYTGASGVEVMISEPDYEKARLVVDQYEKTQKDELTSGA
jgi:hypothetical protein